MPGASCLSRDLSYRLDLGSLGLEVLFFRPRISDYERKGRVSGLGFGRT